MGRMVSSKWLKQMALAQNRSVASHIPATVFYSHGHVRSMLARFGTIVLKPENGTGGIGLMKVSTVRGEYRLKYGTAMTRFRRLQALLRSIDRLRNGRRYLIQQGIALARIAGRPIDYRVKIIKRAGRWKVTGMVGRLARPGLFVTNLCRGGQLLSFSDGLRRSLGISRVQPTKRKLRQTTYTCVQLMERKFPGIDQLGFDYAFDRAGRLWILEVNTKPH